MIEILGLYAVAENSDVSLVEVTVYKNWNEFDVSDFTQEVPGVNRSSWQAPFFERYLNPEGNKVIGDFFKKPIVQKEGVTRMTFYIYYLDQNKQLDTPFGKMKLPAKTNPPDRIQRIIKFEDPE